MRRTVVILASVMGLLLVILAIALASVGTQFDEARIELKDLHSDVDDLQQEVDDLSVERDTLQQRASEQLKTIEQLKAELERVRATQANAQTSQPANTPASPPSGSQP